MSTIGAPDHPKNWPEDKCRNQAALFIDHYKANHWVQGRGKPIKDWEAAVRNWVRRALQGVFEKPQPAPRPADPQRSMPPAAQKAPELSQLQVDVNFLFERWREQPDHVTVISILPEHYNLLKSSRMIAFTEDEVGRIRYETQKHMREKSLEGTIAETRLMKAYGVLEFFNQLKAQAKETVFSL
jgi:hypothetical protein